MDPLFYNIQKTSHYSSNSNHIYIICSLVTVLVLVLHHVLVLVLHHVSLHSIQIYLFPLHLDRFRKKSKKRSLVLDQSIKQRRENNKELL